MRTGEEQRRSRPDDSDVEYVRGRAPARARVRPRRRSGGRRAALWLAVPLLLGCTVPLVARALGRDGPTPVPQLLAFLPWFLVPGWLALVCAVIGRRLFVVAWALAMLGTTAWFLQPYGAGQTVPEQEPLAQVRVLTANLQFGRATEGLWEIMRGERPHLVAVQECDRRCAARLRQPRVRRAYPYQVITGNEPAEGSALLSVYPLRDVQRVPGQLSMPSAVADIEGTDVRVQVAHPMPPMPDSTDSWRSELAALRAMAAARGDTRTIIAGDFNASQDHAAFRQILDTGMRDSARLTGRSRTPTWPAPLAPPFGAQIDHILLSERLTPVHTRFVELPRSDHQGLLADVRIY